MKKKNIIISFFLIVILLSTSAYATVEADIIARMTKSYPNVKRGEEIQVDLYLDNFSYEGKGIDEFVVRIDINEDILEDLTVDNIVTSNGKISLGNNSLVVEDVNTATEDQVVFSNLTTDCDYKIFIDLKNPYTIENYEDDAKIISIKYKLKDNAILGDIENAINYSVDLSQQVTATDLKNGFSNYKLSAVNDRVYLTVVGDSADNEDDDTTNKDDDTTNKDNDTSNKDDDTTNKDNDTTNKNDDTTNKDNDTSNKDNDTSNKDDDTTNKDNDTTNKDNDTTNKDDDTTNNNGNTSNNSGNTSNNNGNTLNNNSSTSNNNNGNNKNQTTAGGTTTTNGNKTNGNTTSLVGGTKLNSTTSKTVLPAAGLKRYILPIIVFAGIALFSYKRYKTYKDIK